MTELYALLLTILVALPPYYGDGELPADRETRLGRIARAVLVQTDFLTCRGDYEGAPDCVARVPPERRLELAAAIVAVGFFESGYARHVHRNQCRLKLGECDNGRARSPWQFQRVPPIDGVNIRRFWWDYRGDDQKSTDGAAYAAGLVLHRGYKNCGSWEGAISQYATGAGCRWKRSSERAAMAARVLRILQAGPDPDDDDDDQGDDDDDQGDE